jgi:hypothetical protein
MTLGEMTAMKTIAIFIALAAVTAGVALITTASAGGGNPQMCLANYNQCLKGCDGATQCSNACKVNYDQCIG